MSVNKTTVYLPDDLESRLNAAAAISGTSKAELIRRGIAMVLDVSQPPRRHPLPVFHSGRERTADQMDDDIHAHIRERAARR